MNNPIIVPMSVSEPESIPMTVSDGETLNFDMRGLFLQGGGGAVTGVKGNAEQDFRTGDVNLSPADLGIDLASLATKAELPTKTSDLTNDSNFVSDANYVHTDTNFTAADAQKLSGLQNLQIQVDNVWQNVTGLSEFTAQGVTGVLLYYGRDGMIFFPDGDGFNSVLQMIQQNYALKSEVPDSTSDLVNDSGYLTLADLPIWNGSIT